MFSDLLCMIAMFTGVYNRRRIRYRMKILCALYTMRSEAKSVRVNAYFLAHTDVNKIYRSPVVNCPVYYFFRVIEFFSDSRPNVIGYNDNVHLHIILYRFVETEPDVFKMCMLYQKKTRDDVGILKRMSYQ